MATSQPHPIFTDEGTVKIMFPPLGKGFVHDVAEEEVLKKIVMDRAPNYYSPALQSLEKVIPTEYRTFDRLHQRYEEEQIEVIEWTILLGGNGKRLEPERIALAERIDEIQGLEISVRLVPYTTVPTDYAREPERRLLYPDGELTKNIPENILPLFHQHGSHCFKEEVAYTTVVGSLLYRLSTKEEKRRRWYNAGLSVRKNSGYQQYGFEAAIHNPLQERLKQACYPFRVMVDEYFKDEEVCNTVVTAAQLVYAGDELESAAVDFTELQKGKETGARQIILQQADVLYTKADKLLSRIPPPETGLKQYLVRGN